MTVDGIQVRSGGRTNDARLTPFDATKTLRSIRVRVAEANGRPVARGTIAYKFLAEGREAPVELALDHGEARVFFVTSHVQFEARADGYVARKIGPVDDDQLVTLERSK
jgi:hypothetical protein